MPLTSIPTLDIPDGRAALARMFIELELAFDVSTYPPGKRVGKPNPERTRIAVAVMLGHAEGHPMNASELATLLKMPRTSVLRRLKPLIARGLIKRSGDRYVLTARHARRAPNLDKFELILSKAFKVLGPLLSKSDR